MPTEQAIDIAWILFSAALVMLMQAGFSALESGLVRTKNSINVAAKNFSDFLLTSVVFWVFGFGLMFGMSAGGLIGTSGFLFGQADTAWLVAFFVFQLGFAATATTIVSGAVAERMRFSSYLIVALLVSAILYPLFGHWAWSSVAGLGGAGWLETLGFIDFAGSTVVHSVGGWTALAATIVVGPRVGRFGGRVRIHGHDLPLVTIGVFLLWVGWFGFNGGSTLALTPDVPLVILNTSISAVFGGAMAMLLTWRFHDHPDVPTIMNGALAGLVGITASAVYVGPVAAMAIGLVAGLVMFGATILLEKRQIDDVVGAVPVHLAAGVWGTLAVALFANVEAFGPGVGRGQQLLVQTTGVVTAFVWVFGLSFVLLKFINRFHPLRVDPEGERQGLNIAEHGASTEIVDLLTEMDTQRSSGDYSEPVTVEPHTEVGQIARQYNRVLEAINEESARKEAALVALRENQKSLQLLQTITSAVNKEPEVEAAYLTALREVCAFTGWPVGHVYVVSSDGGTVAPTDLWEVSDEHRYRDFIDATSSTVLVRGQGLAGKVAEDGSPVRLDLPSIDPSFPRARVASAAGFQSAFAFPVLAQSEVVAVLEFFTGDDAASATDALRDLMSSVGTQLGRAVERRRADETRFRTVVDHMPAMVLLRDLEGRFLLANRRYEEFYKVAGEAVQGHTLAEIQEADPSAAEWMLPEESAEHDAAVLREDRAIERELDLDVDGELVVLASVKFPIPGPSGETVALGGIETDITERKKQEAALAAEREKTESLLLNILPAEVAEELKLKGHAEAHEFEEVTILFSDFENFTGISAGMNPRDLVDELNTCFFAFDQIIDKYDLEKIKTIGDAYMAASGLAHSEPKAANVIKAALEMQEFMARHRESNLTVGKPAFVMRAGIHTGPVVAGIVGSTKFQYDIWGDTVNTASRMETAGKSGLVNISESTYTIVKSHEDFRFTAREAIEVKGKGRLSMFFVRGAEASRVSGSAGSQL